MGRGGRRRVGGGGQHSQGMGAEARERKPLLIGKAVFCSSLLFPYSTVELQ